ncbi:MAG: alkaline phosphatase family protein [Steroidobacteraceae bacterium]
MNTIARGEHRAIVLGLELGDGPLIESMVMRGELPFLGALFREGAHATLSTPAELLHVTALPSLYTGTMPGEHGVYFTFQPAPGLQGYRRFSKGQYGRPTFWKLLDEAGVRCAVLDAPYSHAEEGFGGAYVNDWGNWARYLSSASVPASLLGQLRKACGNYPLGLEAHELGMGKLEATDTASRLLGSIKAKSAAIRWLGEHSRPNLLFSVFGETHVAGHYCYSADEYDAPTLDVYRALDTAIAEVAAWAGPSATLIVVSGDKPAPNNAGWHLLPEIVARLGLLVAIDDQPSGNANREMTRSKRDPVKALRDLLPKDTRKKIAGWLPGALRDRLAQRVDMGGFDWSRTQVYCLPTDLEGCLRVNLRGREPQGIVQPGEEYERLVEQLTNDLLELVDPLTGRGVVKEVLDTRKTFPGSHQQHLPDLVVLWNEAAPIRAVSSQKTGELSLPSPDPRPGSHSGPGFMLARGPGFPAGARLQGASVLDLAPTLLAEFGVVAPEYMTGKPWPAMAGTC